MKEGKNMTKCTHKFRSLLEQLSLARAPIVDDEVMLSLNKSMPMSFRNFISSLWKKQNLTLHALIIMFITRWYINVKFKF